MKEFIQAPKQIYQKAKKQGRLIEGKSLKELKEIASKQNNVILTQMGSISADSEPMSRSAPKTKNSIDDKFGEEERKLANLAEKTLCQERIISLDVPVGESSKGISARFIIPEKYAQLAYGLKLLFGNLKKSIKENPTYQIVFFTDEAFESNKKYKDVREKDITIRLWLGQKRGEQVKICRNSIYLGEAKKGVFQFENWRVKTIDKEGIFLHAGARRDLLWKHNYSTGKPELKKIVTAVAGLTDTGKTVTLCQRLAKFPEEKSEMIGDDGGTFGFSGDFSTFEGNGLYVSTEKLDGKNQPDIYQAVLYPDVFFENVSYFSKIQVYPVPKQKKGHIRYLYVPDFHNLTKTTNGRAVIVRKNLKIASDNLTVPQINNIFIITRNPLINVISKLTPEQATMQFIYGESIESSGGNPAEAGQFKRVFFLDPFVSGDRIEHAMIFYEFLKKNPHIQCFLINTGTIGEIETNISLRDSLIVYNDLLRGRIEFSAKPDILGYHYPIQCNKADLNTLVAQTQFKKKILEKKVKDFLKDRENYLETLEIKGKKIPSQLKDSLE